MTHPESGAEAGTGGGAAVPIVRDWMTKSPITCGPGASLGAVRAQMEREDVQRLLVVDDESSLLGVVSWTDVMAAWPSEFTSLEPFEVRELVARVGVEEIMTRDVVSVEPDATIAEAVNLMFEHRVGALPVVEGRRVVGIFTNSDIRQGLVRILTERRGAAG